MLRIRPVDPHDDSSFQAWYAALREGATAEQPQPLISTYTAFCTSLREPGNSRRRIAVSAEDAGSVVGAMLVELPLREDLATVWIEIDVPPRRRRNGVGTALWRWAEEFAAGQNRTIFQSEVDVPAGWTFDTWPGACFATELGFTSENVEDHLVAGLPFDPQVLAGIEAAAGERDGYDVVSWTGPCPQQYLATFATLRTEMSRDVPTGQVSREVQVWDAERVLENQERTARSYRAFTSLALDRDGSPVGYTEILVPHEDPLNVLQEDTLVLRAHRGHRLGARLKAANLRRLSGHEGTRTALHTWTEIGNVPMQRVNATFGFVKVDTMHEVERMA